MFNFRDITSIQDVPGALNKIKIFFNGGQRDYVVEFMTTQQKVAFSKVRFAAQSVVRVPQIACRTTTVVADTAGFLTAELLPTLDSWGFHLQTTAGRKGPYQG